MTGSERDPQSATHVTNPKVVVEVLSKSTADYDRSEKLDHYRLIPSLACVVLIDGDSGIVELVTRGTSGWSRESFGAGAVVRLDAIGCSISVDDVLAAARNA